VIFKRRAATGEAAAIDAFWTWWATGRPDVEKAIEGAGWDGVIADMTRLVAAIEPGLTWEFSNGTTSRHLLVVTAAGNRALRAVAERWRRAGPDPDETFAFASARQATPAALTSRLSFDGTSLDLSELRFGADVTQRGVNVEVWHPLFAGMPENARVNVAFLALDWLLGEDGVEIWTALIEPVTAPGPDLTGAELAELVSAVAAERDGQWALLRGTVDGRPLIGRIQLPLKAARWPAADTHVRLVVPYHADENGFPLEASLAALRELEDRIVAYADGPVLVASETIGGTRTFHLYADRPAAAEVLEPIVASWSEGRVTMSVEPDPTWESIRHLRP